MNKIQFFLDKYWLLVTGIIFVIILVLSLYPASELPKVPGTDKSHHFIAYTLLALPLALVRPKHWQWLAFSLVCLSGVIELIQPYANRYGEWMDLLANTGGVLVAIILSQLGLMCMKRS